MRKLASFLWWTYPRGTIEYDVMVGLILAFIFLTPRTFFRDQPRPGTAPGNNFSWHFQLVPNAAAASLPQSAPTDLAGVLAAMDAAAPKIKTIVAAVHKTEFFATLNETQDEGSGHLYFDKNGGKPRLAFRIDQPAANVLMYLDGWAWVVQPALKAGNKYPIKGYQAYEDAVFQLGFGGSGAELTRSYRAAYDGPETLDGAATVKLALVPLDPKIAQQFPHVELWLDTVHWVARQQQYWQGKDYTTNRYTEIIVNGPIPKAAFDTHFGFTVPESTLP